MDDATTLLPAPALVPGMPQGVPHLGARPMPRIDRAAPALLLELERRYANDPRIRHLRGTSAWRAWVLATYQRDRARAALGH